MAKNKKREEKIYQLQLMEQNMQNITNQKKQFQAQLAEINSAASELMGKKVAYKIVGTIMVESDAEKLKDELEKKKEIVEIRIKSIEKQEDSIREKAHSLQHEVMNEIEEASEKDGTKKRD